MKKLYCDICAKYRNFEKPKTLSLSIIWSKCKNEDKKLFKEEESIEILKILVLVEIYNYFKNMAEEKGQVKNLDWKI